MSQLQLRVSRYTVQLRGPAQRQQNFSTIKFRMVSEYCSARVSRVGLSTKNRTRTTSSTVLETSLNRTRTKKFPLEELEAVCFLSWVLNWESTENWDFHRLEPYTKPHSDTVRKFALSKILLSWRSHEKQRFGTVLLSGPNAPPPSKAQI